jgi:hypothetical protein
MAVKFLIPAQMACPDTGKAFAVFVSPDERSPTLGFVGVSPLIKAGV